MALFEKHFTLKCNDRFLQELEHTAKHFKCSKAAVIRSLVHTLENEIV